MSEDDAEKRKGLKVANLELVRQLPFPSLSNDLILRACKGEVVERVPIWAMRQAGRYLPEFRAMRAESDFFKVCRTPELACEVTLQPLRRFALDAAIIFSDILVIPQAMGLTVEMIKGKGPHFPEPLVSPDDFSRLNPMVDVQKELGYVFDAITLTRHSLQGVAPLFGFCGAPWTIMAYMVEGGGSKTFSKAKTWLFKYPQSSHELLQRITTISIEYLTGQAKAGAQLLQVFESWGGELSPRQFDEFSLPYLRQIVKGVKQNLVALGLEAVPMVVFAKGSHYALQKLSDVELGGGYDVIGLDWTISAEFARLANASITFQGNLDPGVLYGSQSIIEQETKAMVESFGTQRYIANLGHGMQPDHTPEALGWFIDAVRKYSARV